MKQSFTVIKQFCFLLLFIGLTACGGGEREAFKGEIEETLTEISDEISALKAVKMQQQGTIDGLKEDLKWEYSEELDKLVSEYTSEFSKLKENIEELETLYDAVTGYQEKLGGAPLEYSMSLMKEMFEENRSHVAEILKENEAIEEKFYDLSDRLEKLDEADVQEVSSEPEEGAVSETPETDETTEVTEESSLSETTESAE